MKGDKVIKSPEKRADLLLFFFLGDYYEILKHFGNFQDSVSSCSPWRREKKVLAKFLVKDYIFEESWQHL